MAGSGIEVESEDEGPAADEPAADEQREELDVGAKQEMQLIDEMNFDRFDALTHVATIDQGANATPKLDVTASIASSTFIRPTLPRFLEALNDATLGTSAVNDLGVSRGLVDGFAPIHPVSLLYSASLHH